MALYTLHNIRKKFADREVLRIDSLTLRSGVIYGLLGPNGAGKTTLMRILSFMDTPTSGELIFQGQSVRPDQAAKFRAKVVWVPQTPVMLTGSLLYNVEYPMVLKGIRGSSRYDKAMELLHTVDLVHLANAPAQKLSGGEAQRGSIARALAAGAEVILFDEPTASVDFRSREELIRLIRDLSDAHGLSCIVTTHDAELANELCQAQIHLFDGQVVPHSPTVPKSEPAQGIPLVSIPLSTLRKNGAKIELITPGYGSPYPVTAAIRAIHDDGGKIILSLILPHGADRDAHFADPESIALARTLSLAGTLLIVPKED